MSYHGGVVGGMPWHVLLYCRVKYKHNWFMLADLYGAAIPLGYTFGRLGNFHKRRIVGPCNNEVLGDRISRTPKDFPVSAEWVQNTLPPR